MAASRAYRIHHTLRRMRYAHPSIESVSPLFFLWRLPMFAPAYRIYRTRPQIVTGDGECA
jgi:hypothetical protein